MLGGFQGLIVDDRGKELVMLSIFHKIWKEKCFNRIVTKVLCCPVSAIKIAMKLNTVLTTISS